jgi:iron complex transport system substrate-binding protein
MRIVSLLAGGTEMVFGLGLGDQLVGISHECDYPPEALGLPRVSRPRFPVEGLTSGEIDRALRDAMTRHGGAYEVDRVALRALEPDLILAQSVCEVCAVPTSLAQEAARAMDDRVRVLSLDAHSIEDILGAIQDVGEAAAAGERAAATVSALRRRLDMVRHAMAGLERPRVLALEWLDPPFVPGHWTPEMVAIAGGECLAARAGRPSRQVSWDDLAGLNPDVLIIMPCGFGLDGARADADQHAERLTAVASRAIATGRAFVVDGSAYFNRSGPRVLDGVEILAALLHPGPPATTSLTGRAERWKPGQP